jgi:hypothetical protein
VVAACKAAISEGCLPHWMEKADVEDGHHPGLSDADRKELREASKRIRLLVPGRACRSGWLGRGSLHVAR